MRLAGLSLLLMAPLPAPFLSGTKVARPNALASNSAPGESLPQVFKSALPRLKEKTRVPILLPSDLPKSIEAKAAVVEKAETDEYAISLYSELGIGNAGFVASFSAQARPNYSPRELPNVREVKLSGEISGFFRPVSCGGSCAPANLWWEKGGVVYQIQLSLSTDLSEEDQEKDISSIATSCISAGPR